MSDVPATLPPDTRALGRVKFTSMSASVVALCGCGNRIPMHFTVVAGRAPLKQQCAQCELIVHVAEIHFDTRDLDRQTCNVIFAYQLPTIFKPA